jgi:Icc-related predicted phosphoesterase
VSITLYYASDVHGSEVAWRKFVNAGRHYGVDVLVMGGDIAGKAVVPVVRVGDGWRVRQTEGDRIVPEEELEVVERRVRDLGFYPYRTSDEEARRLAADPEAQAAVFLELMESVLAGWLDLAEDRLAGSGVELWVMLGNDDPHELAGVIAANGYAGDPEGRIIELGEGWTMLSDGYANPTPWDSPRELPEDQLLARLEALAAQVPDMSRCVFNLHVPPRGTAIDVAPRLTADLKPIVRGGSVETAPAGSTAVRALIERYQPPVALHGHIHEARGSVRIGKTVCINPGSEYGEGVLHGALLVLDQRKGLKSYQLVSG